MLNVDKPHGLFFGKEKISPEEVERIKEFARKLAPSNPEKVEEIDLIVKCVQQSLPSAVSELIVSTAGSVDVKKYHGADVPIEVQLLLPAYILEAIAAIHEAIGKKELPIEALLDFWVNDMWIRGFEAEYQRVATKYKPFGPGRVIHYLTSLIRFSLAPVKDAIDKVLH